MHKKRMELYRKGLNDREIARGTGVGPSAIWHWRKRHGLKANQEYQMGKPMENALTPEQCRTMRQFLASLAHYSRKGKNPDVMAFAREWGKLHSKGVV